MSLQSALLKEGTRHLAGVDEAVMKNIEAVRDMSKITRTSLGPQGMNKMVINRHDKLFVTNDSGTILSELDVFHPAARLVLLNAKRLEEDVGDATNFMVSLTGELLTHAESLLSMGLHLSDIINGYEKAGVKASEVLKSMVAGKLSDLMSVEEVMKFMKTPIMSKQYGYEDLISKAAAEACVKICPKNALNFDVDLVRIVKIPGGGISDMRVIKGMVIERDTEGSISNLKKAKVAVYGGGLDFGKPESKDTWLVTNPDQLESFQKAQEDQMEKVIKEIADSGTHVVACHGKIGELAMHFLERYKIMAVKLNSKFDVSRLCRAVNAVPVLRFGAPLPDELGLVDHVRVEEIGSNKVTIFEQDAESSRLSTIILRGATENILDDVERAVDDGIHAYKQYTKSNEFVAGAGACEIELASKLNHIGESITTQDSYAYKKFAEALEVVPRTLAENAAKDPTLIVSNLYAAHSASANNNDAAFTGLDVETGELASAVTLGVFDHLATKNLAISLATEAAISVLKINSILIAKPATGPKPPTPGPIDGGPDF